MRSSRYNDERSMVGSFLIFFLLIRPPRGSTLFPYTTLFRSVNPRVFGALDPRSTGTAGVLGLMVILRSEEHTSELQSRRDLVCRLLLEKKKRKNIVLIATYYDHQQTQLEIACIV